MKMRLILAIAIAVAGLAVGCATTSKAPGVGADSEVSPGLPIASDFRIPDVPVPADFELVRGESFVFQNPAFDVGQVTYAGKEPVASVAQFYIDEMPRYGWKLLNVAEHDSVTLYFDKPDKTATVLLVPKGRGTTVEIGFFPKSKVPITN